MNDKAYTAALLERIDKLEKMVTRWRSASRHYKTSREMWKKRAMGRRSR